METVVKRVLIASLLVSMSACAAPVPVEDITEAVNYGEVCYSHMVKTHSEPIEKCLKLCQMRYHSRGAILYQSCKVGISQGMLTAEQSIPED